MKDLRAHLFYFLKLWLFMLLSYAAVKAVVLPATAGLPGARDWWEYALLPLGQALLFWLAMHLSSKGRKRG